MAARTLTSKGLRVKCRKLNKTNEGLAAELKVARIELTKRADIIHERDLSIADLQGQVKESTDADQNPHDGDIGSLAPTVPSPE